ncbi:MAG: choice-of-anchor F family protein [Pseudomonadota bacterium]|nr:choice-of-anchor F family protein [Pseudomonadota bacterium]
MKNSKTFKLNLIAAACLTVSVPAMSGQIIGVQQGSPSPILADDAQNGFGALNLDNATIKIVNVDTGEDTGKVFDKVTGSYDAMTYGDTFKTEMSDGAGNVMGDLHGKDWPVGEPMGIKALTDPDINAVLSNSKPASCIMSTSYFEYSELPDSNPDSALEGGWLDSVVEYGTEPKPTLCGSPFQTHKRFKVDALPATVDGVESGELGKGIDFVFNVDQASGEAETRRYMVLQKLNNYADRRFGGYKVEVGFGVGENFQNATDAGVNGEVETLTLSLGQGEDTDADGNPIDVWDAGDLATFSAGLFGTADLKHPEDGFFDTHRAGYYVALSEDKTSISTTSVQESNYSVLFGDWLPSAYEPVGIFYDFDDNPLTDARLVAFWADDPATPDEVDYKWLSGDADDFAPISAEQLTAWADDTSSSEGTSLYEIGGIEDLLNLGMTYIIEVGDVSAYPDSTFTLRMTPVVAADQSVPDYVDGLEPVVPVTVEEGETFTGTLEIAPTPEVAQGAPVAIRVTDADLNTDPLVAETVTVTVTNGRDTGEVTLTERGTDYGVFEGVATGYTSIKTATVTVTYTDAANADGAEVDVTATTKVAGSSSNSVSAYDNTSLLASVLAFLGLGALVARRKLSK